MKIKGKNFLIEALQTAVNGWLMLDPESKRRMHLMGGKIVAIELLAVNIKFYIVFAEDKIQLHTGEYPKPDTIIKGTPLRLLHLALSRKDRQKFFSDDVSITGNLELGQKVIDLFDHLEIDWEEILSYAVGDVAAHHVGNFTRRIKSWRQQTRDTLRENVNEYVHEEVEFFPPREATQDFFQDVDELRMDVDRLEARVAQLQKLLDAKRSSL